MSFIKSKITPVLLFVSIVSLVFLECLNGFDIIEVNANDLKSEIANLSQENSMENKSIVIPFESEFSNIVTNPVIPFGTINNSFLFQMEGGLGFQVVRADGKVYIDTYDNDWNYISTKTLEYELSIFGGFYAGDKFNFIVYGENEGEEKYRIVKYDKEFNRLDSISITGTESYTANPLYAGNVSISENGHSLIVYTSRRRPDLHQSNIAIRINTDDMTLLDNNGMLSNPDIHISHSFRQIVKHDGTVPIYVDVSDGYPIRSVYLQAKGVKSVPMLNIDGKIGDNLTDTDVSGLEFSDTHYFVVGTQVHNGVSNVYLSCTNKDPEDTNIDGTWLTGYTYFNSKDAGYAKILKLDNDSFVILWNEVSYGNNVVKYILINSKGQIKSELKTLINARLTQCEPIIVNDKIIWVEYDSGYMQINEISDFSINGVYVPQIPYVEGDLYWDGTSDITWYNEEIYEYAIETAEQLAGLAELVNAGNTFKGKTIYLKNDLFLNEIMKTDNEWKPIAEATNETLAFEGIFHGQGHTIYNMYISEDNYKGGLFGIIGESGVVKAVNVYQSIICQSGSIADTNKGIIAFCETANQVGSSEDSYVGGVCGTNENLVYGCSNNGDVWGNSTAGGIVGRNKGSASTVDSCWNYGIVSATGFSVGGIVGDNYGWIYDCSNYGSVKDSWGVNCCKKVAGICGECNANWIKNCYFSGVLSITGAWMGNDTISGNRMINCYSSFSIYSSVTSLSFSEMRMHSFTESLDKNNNISKWTDEYPKMCDGLPVQRARVDKENGLYKIIPEVWVNKDYSVDLSDKEFQIYADNYSDGEIHYISDSDVLSISDNGHVVLKKEGVATVKLIIDETENFKGSEILINITVNDSLKPTDEATSSFTPETTTSPLPTEISQVTENPIKCNLGYVDDNEKIDAGDALLILKSAAKMVELNEIQRLAADVTKNGKIDAQDALLVLKYAAKIVDHF